MIKGALVFSQVEMQELDRRARVYFGLRLAIFVAAAFAFAAGVFNDVFAGGATGLILRGSAWIGLYLFAMSGSHAVLAIASLRLARLPVAAIRVLALLAPVTFASGPTGLISPSTVHRLLPIFGAAFFAYLAAAAFVGLKPKGIGGLAMHLLDERYRTVRKEVRPPINKVSELGIVYLLVSSGFGAAASALALLSASSESSQGLILLFQLCFFSLLAFFFIKARRGSAAATAACLGICLTATLLYPIYLSASGQSIRIPQMLDLLGGASATLGLGFDLLRQRRTNAPST